MDNVATICQSGFSGCLLACLAKRMGLCGVVRGATRENGLVENLMGQPENCGMAFQAAFGWEL